MRAGKGGCFLSTNKDLAFIVAGTDMLGTEKVFSDTQKPQR
jgi:hypothetical protein